MKSDSKKDADTDDIKPKWRWFWLPALGVVVMWILTRMFVDISSVANSGFLDSAGKESEGLYAVSGQFGDQYGYINALFSGLAFAALIYTMYLQRIELNATRRELRGQKEQFEIQNKILKQQCFEDSFFRMMGALSRVHDDVVYIDAGAGKTFTGRNAMIRAKEILHGKIVADVRCKDSVSPEEFKDKLIERLVDVWSHDVGSQFAGPMALLNYIVQSILNANFIEDKAQFFNILKGNISRDFLEVIFLFSLVKSNRELKGAWDSYSFFDVSFDFLDSKTQEYKIFYRSSALGLGR